MIFFAQPTHPHIVTKTTEIGNASDTQIWRQQNYLFLSFSSTLNAKLFVNTFEKIV